MEYSVDKDIVTVVPSDRIDVDSSEDLQKELLDLIINGHRKFIVDFNRVYYLSSSGMRVFLIIIKKLTEVGGSLVFFSVQEDIQEIIDAAGFNSTFIIFSTKKEALEHTKNKEII